MAPFRPPWTLAQAIAPKVIALAVVLGPASLFVLSVRAGLEHLVERVPSRQEAVRLEAAPAPSPSLRPPRPLARPAPPPPPSREPTTELLWLVAERYCVPLAEAVCRIADACCSSPPAACEDELYAACTAQVARLAELDLTRFRFEPELVRTCLEQIDLGRARCELGHLSPFESVGICPLPLVDGSCIVRAQSEIGCVGAECDVCTLRARPGVEVEDDVACWVGTTPSDGRCVRLPRRGEACDDECEPGMWCEHGRCVMPALLGERCTYHEDCLEGLRCEHRTCRAEPRWCAISSECGTAHRCFLPGGLEAPHCPRHGRDRGCGTGRSGTCEPSMCERDVLLGSFGGPVGERVSPPE